MKLSASAFANASTLSVMGLYVICRLAFLLFPDLAMAVANSWFHGIDLTKIASFNVSPGSFILGLVSISAVTWITGYVFVRVYNLFIKS